MGGVWLDGDVLDMRDPAPDGNDTLASPACGWGPSLSAHHCWVTAVHAALLHTNKLLMFHGVGDQRVLSLDTDATLDFGEFLEPAPGAVAWTPLAFRSVSPDTSIEWKDLFCSGHAQLADGSVLVAGGNIDGTPGGGGLRDVFRYESPRFSIDEALNDPGTLSCPYFWELEPGTASEPWTNPNAEMLHDRWYPTLTTLRDGRVLIAGGFSRVAGGDPADESAGVVSNLIEIYDPETKLVSHLNADDGDGDTDNDAVYFYSDFNDAIDPNDPDPPPRRLVPNYPFMFQLPNGDVIYAGGESPATPGQTSDGMVLVAPENSTTGRWEWANHTIDSTLTGGSAVMYEPGKILKTGGRALNQDDDGIPGGDAVRHQTSRAEILDLSGIEGGEDSYDGLSFTETDPMAHPRHYHNMVILPNGRVVTVGGNRAGNGDDGERWENPCCTGGGQAPELEPVPSRYACEQGGTPVVDQSCLQGCASSCETYYTQSPNILCSGEAAGMLDPQSRCAYLEGIACCEGRGPGGCGDAPNCSFDGTCDGGTNDGAACALHGDCNVNEDDDFSCVGSCVEEIAGLSVGRCEDAMQAPGVACVDGWCRKSCDPEGDPATECPVIMPVGSENVCLLVANELPTSDGGAGGDGSGDSTSSGEPFAGYCSPANNECFAEYSAEVWDPSCELWTETDDQIYPRLYHSTALLLPTGNVASMGGGHRDIGTYYQLNDYPFLETFVPDYALGSGESAPTIDIRDADGNPLGVDEEKYLPWWADPLNDGSTEPRLAGRVTVQTCGDVGGFSILRLGSTTHGFDQDQRFARLGFLPSMDEADEDGCMLWDVFAPQDVPVPQDENDPSPLSYFQTADTVLPPGYYMLFATSPVGVPSRGAFVRVGPDETFEGLCQADPGIIAPTVEECSGEPIGGTCDAADVVNTSLALPQTTDGGGSSVDGWRVVLEPGLEPDALPGLCAAACEQHFTALPNTTASCGAPGAFSTSIVAEGTPATVDMLLASQRNGGETSGGQAVLDCDLGEDCWTYFDEALHVARARRLTPAGGPLGVGEESVVDLDGSSVLLSCGSSNAVTMELYGEAGFSDARHADTSGDRPFYLGSLELSSTPPGGTPGTQSFSLQCEDGTTESVSLGEVGIRLVQPAFGVQRRDEDEVRFGPSAMQVWVEVTVDGETYVARRPSPRELRFDHDNGALDGAAMSFGTRVPCGVNSFASLDLWLDIDSGAALEAPPTSKITMPGSVSCGSTVSLSGSFGDPDGDVGDVRWSVDGVPLEASVTSIAVTESHEISATAYDSRGAATTAFHTLGCN